MGTSLVTGVVAVLVGGGLAAAAAVGVVSSQTSANTATNDQTSVSYDN